jgi:flagella basal body P-ring formation protein FlgA
MKLLTLFFLGASLWGFQASAPVRAAGPLRPPPPDVQHGDKVEVTVSVGHVVLSFEAVAESSGHTGETVIVRNPENGRRFVARVQEAGKVGIRK